MLRDYSVEYNKRVEFIRRIINDSHSSGIVFGNSGGKDSALVGILCKAACENTVGVLMPCASSRNFGQDTDDALALAQQFNIAVRRVDLTPLRAAAMETLSDVTDISPAAAGNLSSRMRMMTLYTIAASENLLVAGTGNRSEIYMGYFTKWGDGACDLNPIADLTVTEIFEFLEWLNAPEAIIKKAPSAALSEGQTDEDDMGVTYKAIDSYIMTGETDAASKEIIDRYHFRSGHKRDPFLNYYPGR